MSHAGHSKIHVFGIQKRAQVWTAGVLNLARSACLESRPLPGTATSTGPLHRNLPRALRPFPTTNAIASQDLPKGPPSSLSTPPTTNSIASQDLPQKPPQEPPRSPSIPSTTIGRASQDLPQKAHRDSREPAGNRNATWPLSLRASDWLRRNARRENNYLLYKIICVM